MILVSLCRGFVTAGLELGLTGTIYVFFQVLSELFFFLPKTLDLLDGAVKNNGRLLRMLPSVFRELSSAFSVSFRVVVALFVQIAKSDDIMIFLQKSSKIHYF